MSSVVASLAFHDEALEAAAKGGILGGDPSSLPMRTSRPKPFGTRWRQPSGRRKRRRRPRPRCSRTEPRHTASARHSPTSPPSCATPAVRPLPRTLLPSLWSPPPLQNSSGLWTSSPTLKCSQDARSPLPCTPAGLLAKPVRRYPELQFGSTPKRRRRIKKKTPANPSPYSSSAVTIRVTVRGSAASMRLRYD